jgi:hypothetical protein
MCKSETSTGGSVKFSCFFMVIQVESEFSYKLIDAFISLF